MFISPHKFIGGPGTPGLLVAKKKLFANRIPSNPGGGTVSWVTSKVQHYYEDPIHREEGGTPAIIESIRAGTDLPAEGGGGLRDHPRARA